jgi:hypothetical protein
MPKQWKEIVRLRFKGPRFQDHALDLTALGELSQFQAIVAETAKALWYAAHPGAGRLPNRFEERIRLCLRSIEEGSTVTPLEVEIDEPEQTTMCFVPQPEIVEAVGLAREVFEAVETDTALPERLPKQLISEYAKWGQLLADDEEVEIEVSGQPHQSVARVNRRNRERLRAFAEGPYENTVEIIGEVFEADVRAKRFQVRTERDETIAVPFSPEQEQRVTGALKDHQVLRVRVTGRAEVLPDGKIARFRSVDDLLLVKVGAENFDPNAPAIEDVLAEIAAQVPPDEWAKLPQDLSENLDRHIYGESKQ